MTYGWRQTFIQRSHTAKLGPVPLLLSFPCPSEAVRFHVKKLLQSDEKVFGWRAGKGVGEGGFSAQLLAQIPSPILTVSLALMRVSESDFKAATRLPQLNTRHDTAYLYELSRGLTQSLAHHRHALKCTLPCVGL